MTCNEHEGCFRFGRFVVVWDAHTCDWVVWDNRDILHGSFRTLADAKEWCLR